MMGAGKGRTRRASSAQSLVRTGTSTGSGLSSSYRPPPVLAGADPGRSRELRAEAFNEVLRIIEELRGAGLREEALRVLYTSANLLYNSSSVGEKNAQRAIVDFYNLLDMIEQARPGAMVGSFAYPGESARLRHAFAACAPSLDVSV